MAKLIRVIVYELRSFLSIRRKKKVEQGQWGLGPQTNQR
jgi:hypothetical protein